MGAVVTHVNGRRVVILPDATGDCGPVHLNIYDACRAAAELLETMPPLYPVPVKDGLFWLALVGKAGVTGEALRVATVIARTQPADWLGLREIGRRVAISEQHAHRAIGVLIAAGLLIRQRRAGRCFYQRAMP